VLLLHGEIGIELTAAFRRSEAGSPSTSDEQQWAIALSLLHSASR
jgi:hypothetical protein